VSDLLPATDGLFLGETTTPRRWDGSRLINLPIRTKCYFGSCPTPYYCSEQWQWLSIWGGSWVAGGPAPDGEAPVKFPIFAGKFSKLRVKITNSSGMTTNLIITLRKNGANTALTVTIPANTDGSYNSVVDVFVINNDLVDISMNWQTNPAGAYVEATWLLEYQPS